MILEKSQFDVDANEIGDVEVLATMMDRRFTLKVEMPEEDKEDLFSDRETSRGYY